MPAFVESSITEDIHKPLVDNRAYRYLELKNGLRIMLISDPKADKAAACMAVRIGSLFDDMRCQGLAHFLEHMLFLGTKKYPKEDSYNEYLAKNGGSSNAYTSSLHTVYYFNVAKEGLEGALDRFAQFFLEPLFTESATDRELNAVHSEHTKNMQSDAWRMNQLQKNKMNEKHPLHRFATGNLETLVEDPKKHGIILREKLLEFHEKYYSSNIMTLSVIGYERLDELQNLVLDKFEGIQNKNVSVPHGGEIGKGIDAVLPTSLKAEQSVVPVKDVKSVTFNFRIPEQWELWETKPSKYLSHLLGHEGKGSIYSVLKEKGLATELCSGQALDEAGLSLFSVDINLTEKGESHIAEVGEVLFSYINLLQEEKKKVKNSPRNAKETTVFKKVFEEMQKIDAMSFKFRSLPDPMSAVLSIATGLQEPGIPPQKVFSAPSLLWRYDQDQVFQTLDTFTLENMTVLKVGKKLEPECTETEHWYGTKHSKESPLSDKYLKLWANPRGGTELGLELFNPNPFIASKLDFKPLQGEERQYPVKYCLENGTSAANSHHLYHKQDSQFKLPKMIASLIVYSSWASGSVKNMLITEAWAQALSEELNEFSYDAEIAGVSYKLAADTRGFSLELGGYDEKLGELMKAVVMKMAEMSSVKEKTWELVRERLERDLLNASLKRQPYLQAMSIHKRMTTKGSLLFGEKLEEFRKLKVEDLNGVNNKLLKGETGYHLEGLVMGNASRDETRELVKENFCEVVGKLGGNQSSTLKQIPKQETLFLKDGKTLFARFKGTNPAELNGSACLTMQIDKTSVPVWMQTSLYSQITSQKFFDELRTKQQLGYIVASQPVKNAQKSELVFLVQSEQKPSHCMRKIEEFLDTMQTRYFGENAEEGKSSQQSEESEFFNPAVFEEYSNALISQLEEQPKKLSEEFSQYWTEVRDRTNDFSRRERSIKFLKELKYQDFLLFCRSIGVKNKPAIRVEVVPSHQWDEEKGLGGDGSDVQKYFEDDAVAIDKFYANESEMPKWAEWLCSEIEIKGDNLSKL